MFVSGLTDGVATLRGVGPRAEERLARLGVRTVADLALLFPREYEDRTTPIPLGSAAGRGKVFCRAAVVRLDEVGRGPRRIPKAVISDGRTQASLVCFGRSFLGPALSPGREFFLWGSYQMRYGELSCSDFELEPASEHPRDFGRILPVYPLTEGIGQAAMRRLVRAALDAVPGDVEDELPEPLAARRGLWTGRRALEALHRPASMAEAELARRSYAYGELFYLELALFRRRRSRSLARRTPAAASRSAATSRAVAGTAAMAASAATSRAVADLPQALRERLPFPLTGDQERVLSEIRADLAAPVRMSRLLQGDVGCGKTLVAWMAALAVIGAGSQAAFAAPTELLARQHAENAARLLEPLGIRIAFLSGRVGGEPRRLLLSALAAGEVDLVVGTHALFSEGVSFRDLGLVIVDEQHKFGVLQRTSLVQKGQEPDLLLMTATPIPRTLALAAFGDLDVSVIRGMPPGRKPVITHLSRQSNEEKVYKRVREEIDRGRQAYFVYPLIEGSESLAVKDAQSAFRRLSDSVYPGLPMALLHSRVPEDEKERAMDGFVHGRTRVLVATSVVEVGVDVPNATCMVIEHAERFGLSSLHQLRGRVGRCELQSYAFLVYGDGLTPEGIERLRIMKETSDGFRIAEKDMELRGPGEVLGVRQSGFLRFRAADLGRDADLLAAAGDDARRIVEEDPDLLHGVHAVLARVLAAAPPAAAAVLDAG